MSFQRLIADCNTWSDFSNLLSGCSKTEKGDFFEHLVKCALLTDPTYRTRLRDVWLLSELPETKREYLTIPRQDEGIDIVAETIDGVYWAVQCKYRTDINENLSRRELATFFDLSFNISRKFQFALVCTNTGSVTRKINLYQDRVGILSNEYWEALDRTQFEAIKAKAQNNKVVFTAKEPRPHQIQVLNDVEKYFSASDNSRGKLIMPCGSGKSLCGVWIAQLLEAKNVLLLVPSLTLVRQSLQVWTGEYLANERSISWIAVCSDSSLKGSEDSLTATTSELGIEVSTDSSSIQRWLETKRSELSLVVSTYQSAPILMQAIQDAETTFDLVIYDEAHRTTGPTSKKWARTLDDAQIPATKKLFMTATERVVRGKNTTNILSMDDPIVYGETIHKLSFVDCIEKYKVLTDYKVIILSVTEEEIKSLIQEDRPIEFIEKEEKASFETTARIAASHIAIQKLITKYKASHIISFHSRVNRASSFAKEVSSFQTADETPVETWHIAGHMPTPVRSGRIRSFEQSNVGLLTNARCLVEGVDIPVADGAFFVDPKHSAVDIVQAVGRILRKHPNKECSYVLVPVIEGLDRGEQFVKVADILKKLATGDETLIDEMREVQEGKSPSSKKVIYDFDEASVATKYFEDFEKEIDLKVWNVVRSLAFRPFVEARAYARSLKIRGFREWVAHCKGQLEGLPPLPIDIPQRPGEASAYRHAWKGYGDWLGTFAANRNWMNKEPMDFQEARTFARKLNLKSHRQWREYCKGGRPDLPPKPENLPSNLDRTYLDKGFTNLQDFLGYSYEAPKWRSYSDARQFVHGLKLKNNIEWQQYCNGLRLDLPPKPSDIPRSVETVYVAEKGKGIFTSWGDFLGTG